MEKPEQPREVLVTRVCTRLDAITRTALDLAHVQRVAQLSQAQRTVAQAKRAARREADKEKRRLKSIAETELRAIQIRLSEELRKVDANAAQAIENADNAYRKEGELIDKRHETLVNRATTRQAAMMLKVESLNMEDLMEVALTMGIPSMEDTK